jgi:branched-chain amino acid transport system substrate-binding protein
MDFSTKWGNMKWNRSGRALTSLALVATGCVTVLVGSSGPADAAKAKSPIIIGNMADLTGNATVGIPGNYGVQFAVKQINAHGGIDGHKLVLDTADSQFSVMGGTGAARQLTEKDHAKIVINTSASDSAIPSLPIFQAAETPIIVAAASDPEIVNPANSFAFMTPAVPVSVDVQAYLKYMKKEHYTNVGLIYPTAALGLVEVSDLEDAAPAFGITFTTTQSYVVGTTDYSSQIAAVQATQPQAVFVIGDLLGNVVKEARGVGLDAPFMYDASATDALLINSIGATAAAGVVSFQTQATQLLDATAPPITTWVKEFNTAFPSPPSGVPSQFSLEGYEATFVAAQALLMTLNAKRSLTGNNIHNELINIKGFVLGKTGFRYAVPIAYPVSFTKTNHVGDDTVTPVIVENGIWVKAP